MFSYKPIRRGAVVQPGLGRQIVNLEVAGSNPVGPAIFYGTVSWDVNPRPGVPKGVCPLREEHTRGRATRGITSVKFARAGELVSRPELAPSVGADEARVRAELATERGSNPVGPAIFHGRSRCSLCRAGPSAREE